MSPLVWIGSQCGVVMDAMPGTCVGSEQPCDYCGDECVCVACDASEFEKDGGVEEEKPPELEEWEVALEAAYWRAAGAERIGSFGPKFLNLRGWSPNPPRDE